VLLRIFQETRSEFFKASRDFVRQDKRTVELDRDLYRKISESGIPLQKWLVLAKEEVVPILALGREGVLPVLSRRERAVPVLLLKSHRDYRCSEDGRRTKMRCRSNVPRSAPAL
jgi:hypothetical protein